MNKALTISLIIAIVVIISLVVYYKMFPKVVTVTKTVNTWRGHDLSGPAVIQGAAAGPITQNLSTDRIVRFDKIVKKK